MKRTCQLGRVSRAGFYRSLCATPEQYPDLELRDAIQRVALEFPTYGWPHMTRELVRRGLGGESQAGVPADAGGQPAVPAASEVRDHHRLCARLAVYPNLAREMILTGVDQLWVADITYIRLLTEFVYLAVIVDAFSRRVIGWALDRTLETELTLQALGMALVSSYGSKPEQSWLSAPALIGTMGFPLAILGGLRSRKAASASPADVHRAAGRRRSTIEEQRTARRVLTACLSQGDNSTSTFPCHLVSHL